MTEGLGARYLTETTRQLQKLKALADRALEQATDQDYFVTLDPESNSIAVLLKHVAGNMRSRWIDFLTSDGEKPDRNRDREFALDDADTPEALREQWNQGWHCLFAALEPLSPQDLDRTIFIRGEPHSVTDAIGRQLTHYATHVGQIVFLVKHLRGPKWRTLSIPRGRSQEVLEAMREKWSAVDSPRTAEG